MDIDEEIRHLERIAHWMDSRFVIPGTGFRFGIDSIVGLIPALGDVSTALPAAYIIHRAERLGAPGHVLARMMVNLGVDLAIGAVPLLGDLFDLGFKSNRRNVALLREHFESAGRQAKLVNPRARNSAA